MASCTALGLAGDRRPSTAMNPTRQAIPARASVRVKDCLIHGLRCGKAARSANKLHHVPARSERCRWQLLARLGRASPVSAALRLRMGCSRSLILRANKPLVNSSTLWLDQAFPKGVANELGDGMDVELAHRGRTMSLDRLDADAEQLRNLLVSVALGDELNHFTLPRR
jgi:hypothetical protein